MNTAHVLLRTHCIRCLAPYVNVAVKHNVRHPRSHEHCTSLSKACAQQAQRVFHSSPQFAQSQHAPSAPDEGNEDEQGKIKKSMVTFNDLFEKAHKTAKTKDSFNKVVDVFNKRDIRRRGHVEFIYAALRKMPEFGVQSDVTVYNKLLDVFPKEVFVPRNFIQRMFNHYPRQQECGVEVLEQMENYGVMPNVETKVLLTQIFGPKSHPMRKYQRIMYWFPKFKNANPYPVPRPLPEDPVDIAQYSLARIANDLDARVTVYQMPHTDIAESGEEVEEPHIVGIQSPEQQSLLARHDPSKPLFVEGPFPLWLRRNCVYYYVLKADSQVKEEDVDPELVGPYQTLHFPVWIDLETDRDLGDNFSFDVEDLEEGPVFAMCMVGRGDQATLGRWISGLQETNPMLGQVPTLFRLDVSQRELQDPTLSQRRQQHQQESHKPHETHGSHYSESEHRTEPDHVAEEDHGTQRVKQ